MNELAKQNNPYIRKGISKDDAIKYFEEKGDEYKLDLLQGLNDGDISFYTQGAFTDLCRGPHIPATGAIKAIKLTSISGAYWKGDEKNKMLTRVYGVTFPNKQELDAYLLMLEEAKKRDHRKLGKELSIYTMDDDIGQGLVLWMPNGTIIIEELEKLAKETEEAGGYKRVVTPHIAKESMYLTSGHLPYYADSMFPPMEMDGEKYYLKAMNCPHHHKIFAAEPKSYRDLPLRMAEFGACHRYEPSGSLHGLMRVRAFTQDDAHIFCTEDQIASETVHFVALLSSIYADFGFPSFRVKFSDRPATRAGTDATWDRAEGALRDACKTAGVEYELNPGEGAFYGPKLEFVLRDAIGRDWQCGTLQVDFVLPERLDAEYVGEDGARHRPVMLHRAILGSFERFLGILIEQYAGRFPLWLAPVQVAVATIVSDADAFAGEVAQALRGAGLSVKLDTANQKINAKVREHSLQHVPVMLVVGRNEAAARTVAIRRLGSQAQEILPLEDAVAMLAAEAAPPDLRGLHQNA